MLRDAPRKPTAERDGGSDTILFNGSLGVYLVLPLGLCGGGGKVEKWGF